jgi:hypothetical protein
MRPPQPALYGRAQVSAPPIGISAPPVGVSASPISPSDAAMSTPPMSTPPTGLQGAAPRYSDLVSMPGQAAPPVPARKNRRPLVIALVVAAVLVLLAIAGTGVVMALNNAGASTFAVNSCVKKDGSAAVKASCSDGGAYTIVSKVDRQEDCPDPNQPFVVLEHRGEKDQVLCLRPASQK